MNDDKEYLVIVNFGSYKDGAKELKHLLLKMGYSHISVNQICYNKNMRVTE